MAIIFFLLYTPIAVMVLFSFNGGESTSVMDGLSFQWYFSLLEDPGMLEALKNSLWLALSSATVSTVIGTLAAVGLAKMRSRWFKQTVRSVTNIPMMNPEIVTGISMMLLFVFISQVIFRQTDVKFGYFTLLIAHVTFNLPYVILSVSPKINQLDKFLPEAAQDLGCTPFVSFLKVELPNLLPAILSGFIMAFTLSLDDFVISYFNGGDVYKTLPVLIYTYTKKPVKPDIYALFTLLVISILLLMVLSNLISSRGERKERRQGGQSRARSKAKK